MALTSDDYENIWLRCKDKFQNWVSTYLLKIFGIPILFFSISMTYLVYIKLDDMINSKIQNTISDEVERQLKSEDLSKKIISNTLSKLDNIEKKLNILNDTLEQNDQKIKNYLNNFKNLGISYSNNRFILTTETGKQLIIEQRDTNLSQMKASTITRKNKVINFSKEFKNIPIVFCNKIIGINSLRKNIPISITNITKKNFTISIKTNRIYNLKDIDFRWIAISQEDLM